MLVCVWSTVISLGVAIIFPKRNKRVVQNHSYTTFFFSPFMMILESFLIESSNSLTFLTRSETSDIYLIFKYHTS